MTSVTALPTSYVVTDGLRAGAYPASTDAVQALEEAGVSTFVDLTHPSDPAPTYDQLLRTASRIALPLADMGTPTVGRMMRILDEVDACRAEGTTVYVHCLAGVGRTGTVVGCWLVRHGLDAGDPIERIVALRAGIVDAAPSPETPGQVALVRSWRPGR